MGMVEGEAQAIPHHRHAAEFLQEVDAVAYLSVTDLDRHHQNGDEVRATNEEDKDKARCGQAGELELRISCD